jgi:hypothetical protein
LAFIREAGIGICLVALARRSPPALVHLLRHQLECCLETWVGMREDLRASWSALPSHDGCVLNRAAALWGAS